MMRISAVAGIHVAHVAMKNRAIAWAGGDGAFHPLAARKSSAHAAAALCAAVAVVLAVDANP